MPTKLKIASNSSFRYWPVLFQVKRTESGDKTDTFNLKLFPRSPSLSPSQVPGLRFPLPPVARRDKKTGKNKLEKFEVRAVEAMRI